MPQPIANGQSANEPPKPLPPTELFAPDKVAYGGLSGVPSPGSSRKKLFIITGASSVLLIALILGVVFGYYLPNKPENAYKTSLERSGKAINKIIEQSTTKDKLEQIKKSEFAGTLDISSKDGSVNGTFNTKLDPTKSDNSIDVKLKQKDKPDQTFGVKILTDLPKDKRFPNTYFKLTGFKDLGLDSFVPGVGDYDGKWISVDSDYLESLSSAFIPPAEQKNKENVSAEEVAHLIKTVDDVTNEYVFTSDPTKTVIENRGYLGKEKTEEGVNAFHYNVGINKDHALAYCKALSDKFLSESAVKKIADMDDTQIADAKKSASDDCDTSAKDPQNDETFEMWVDAKYKVIHKFRFYEDVKKKDSYTDFGQVYKGGDKLALFSHFHQDKDNLNIKFTLDVDIKGNNSKAEITGGQDGDNSFTGKASLSAKPYNGELNVSKPDGAIPIKDVLAKFGFDPSGISGISPSSTSSPSVSDKASDSDRKADIQAIYSQLEVYFAENSFYPNLSQLNNKAFRTANMKGLTDAALTPPSSTNASLAAVASASAYGYTATDCNAAGATGCQAFTLTALLSTGEKYTKTGSNN
jgi:hypothetical protein